MSYTISANNNKDKEDKEKQKIIKELILRIYNENKLIWKNKSKKEIAEKFFILGMNYMYELNNKEKET